MLENNKYSDMQKNFYDLTADKMIMNHREHNKNKDYWRILLSDIREDAEFWSNKRALDFGCGHGRNIINIFPLADWKAVEGVDISKENIKYAEKNTKHLKKRKYDIKFYVNNGYDLADIKSNRYDFVMSTITFQHICVHEIRYNLLSEIYRVMRPGALFSFQMGHGKKAHNSVGYYENFYDAKGTNSDMDCRVDKEEYLIEDLKKIGFTMIEYQLRTPFSDTHENWIYVKCYKPN